MTNTNPLSDREIIIELRPFGNVMKVSAMDTKTLTEVTIQGPLNASEAVLKNNATKRLEYVLRKNGHID